MKRNIDAIKETLLSQCMKKEETNNPWNDGENIIDWAKRSELSRKVGTLITPQWWQNSFNNVLVINETHKIDSQNNVVLVLNYGNVNNRWQRQSFLFLPIELDSKRRPLLVKLNTTDTDVDSTVYLSVMEI